MWWIQLVRGIVHKDAARDITDKISGVTKLLHKPTLMVAAERYRKAKA